MLNKLMTGRLGNQMFQYAAVRAYQIKNNIDSKINLDFRLVRLDGEKKDGFYNQLDYFNLSDNVVYDQKMKINICQYILVILYFVGYKFLKFITKKDEYINKKINYEKKIQKFLNKQGLFVYSYGYYPFKKTKKKNNLFIGFYESSKFFDDIKDVLRKEFEPKYNKLEKNKKLYKKIEQSESVCVSIRRGDFLAEKYKSKHYVCTPEYFEKSISLMLKKIKNAQFIVFSDDINWVKNNMKFPANTLYESGDDPVWEKLRLMYSCKHFIISNSTFSWWAQYLSKNEKKIVIAPSQWLNGQKNPDFYDKKWSLVDISSLKKRD